MKLETKQDDNEKRLARILKDRDDSLKRRYAEYESRQVYKKTRQSDNSM